MDWNHILNWKLLPGSHKFPGPDGGTCINEAAVVAAGFPYRKIRKATDCPPCFSRPIAAYAIRLNDIMDDNMRQRLLPFVTRLAGSADTRDVEVERVKLIVRRTVQDILPGAIRLHGQFYAAQYGDIAIDAVAVGAESEAAWYAADAVAAAAVAAAAIADYAGADVFGTAISILDEALRVGRQANPIEAAVVVDRMNRAKAIAHERPVY